MLLKKTNKFPLPYPVTVGEWTGRSYFSPKHIFTRVCCVKNELLISKAIFFTRHSQFNITRGAL